MPKLPLRIAVCGTGRRVEHHYAPILKALRPELEWVGLWGRNSSRVAELSERFGVRGFSDLDAMVSEAKPDILLLCILSRHNGPMALQLAKYGRALFLETPIAIEIDIADRLIEISRDKGFPIEIAEQIHRRPVEELKRVLIRNGVFGKVLLAANDFVVNSYHAVSLIRSYIGFERQVVRVAALGPKFPVNVSFGPGIVPPAQEEWQTALLEFDDGTMGQHVFSSIGYDSRARSLRSVRFYAEKGMGRDEELIRVPPGTNDQERIPLEKTWRDIQGRPVLQSVIARTNPETVWINPFADRPLHEDDLIATALCLRSLINAVVENKPVEYGAEQARQDQAVTDAIQASINSGGQPAPVRPFRDGSKTLSGGPLTAS
ncbi:MAG: Gfo/Idh/MocA family protein [Elusimicrobiota bacterium]